MDTGKYLLALTYVRPCQEAWFPALFSKIQVDLTGKPVAACK